MGNPYSFMHELGFGAQTVISLKDMGSIDTSFLSTEILPEGCQVKVTGDGTVGKVTAITDSPIGMVSVSEQKHDRIRVVVKTQFMAIARAKAADDITAGMELSAVAMDSGGELMSYAPYASPNKRVAVALTSGLDTEEIVVGILRVAY